MVNKFLVALALRELHGHVTTLMGATDITLIVFYLIIVVPNVFFGNLTTDAEIFRVEILCKQHTTLKGNLASLFVLSSEGDNLTFVPAKATTSL